MKQYNNSTNTNDTSDILTTIKYLSIYVSIITTVLLICTLCGVDFIIN